VKICRQHKWVIFKPLHYGKGLLLLDAVDRGRLKQVGEVAVQVDVLGVCPARGSPHVPCKQAAGGGVGSKLIANEISNNSLLHGQI